MCLNDPREVLRTCTVPAGDALGGVGPVVEVRRGKRVPCFVDMVVEVGLRLAVDVGRAVDGARFAAEVVAFFEGEPVVLRGGGIGELEGVYIPQPLLPCNGSSHRRRG